MIYPIALEAVQQLDALFDIERAINGRSPAERLAVRQELSAPLMAELHAWLNDAARQAVAQPRSRQGHQLHAAPLGRVHPLPRRRQGLPHEQRRRTGAALRAARPQGVAVLRLRSRRPARRRHLHPDPDRRSTTSIPRPGSPTSSPASPTIPSAGSTSCCPGTGKPSLPPSPPEIRLRRGLRRMLTEADLPADSVNSLPSMPATVTSPSITNVAVRGVGVRRAQALTLAKFEETPTLVAERKSVEELGQ